MGGFKLRAFWWRPPGGGGNAGDEVTPHLLNNFFKIPFEYAQIKSCNFISTGSILGWVFKEAPFSSHSDGSILVIGSGFMDPSQAPSHIDERITIESVRGHLTRVLLPEKLHNNVSIGDPGLLVGKAYREGGNKATVKFKYGIIPHLSYRNKDCFFKAYEKLHGAKFIDIGTSDVNNLLAQMMECEVIVSQSLHGLVFADSLGIPNVWVDHGALGRQKNDFKFYDYFSSIDRPFNKKLKVTDYLKDSDIMGEIYEPKMSVITSVSENIENSFRRHFFPNCKGGPVNKTISPFTLDRGLHVLAYGDFRRSVKIVVELECSLGVVNGGALLSFSFRTIDGHDVGYLVGNLINLSLSKDSRVGYFKYLSLRAGRSHYEVVVDIPEGISLREIKIGKWKKPEQEVSLLSGVVKSL